jgi:hypothetical protein
MKDSPGGQNREVVFRGRSFGNFATDVPAWSKRGHGLAAQEWLDQYFTSVRELERRLASQEGWEHWPKPRVNDKAPQDIDDPREFVRKTELMFDAIKLALETDSSRLISLFIDTTVIHNITHHGNRPEVLAELRSKEEAQFAALGKFLRSLDETKEQGESLLDRTMVLYGTCMGSASSHSNLNLPVLLAGGGFRHGQHLASDTKNDYPLIMAACLARGLPRD